MGLFLSGFLFRFRLFLRIHEHGVHVEPARIGRELLRLVHVLKAEPHNVKLQLREGDLFPCILLLVPPEGGLSVRQGEGFEFKLPNLFLREFELLAKVANDNAPLVVGLLGETAGKVDALEDVECESRCFH